MLANVIKALNDPVRRKILDLLKERPLNAGDILSHLEISGATLSHHLKILNDAGLVTKIRDGNFIIYEVNTSVMEDVMKWLSSFMDRGDQNE
jgi:DNA-binding transcriptional ArsR family regulator